MHLNNQMKGCSNQRFVLDCLNHTFVKKIEMFTFLVKMRQLKFYQTVEIGIIVKFGMIYIKKIKWRNLRS